MEVSVCDQDFASAPTTTMLHSLGKISSFKASSSCHDLLSLLQDGCFMLRCLSFFNSDAFQMIEQLKAAVDFEVRNSLDNFIECLSSFSRDDVSDAAEKKSILATSCWNMCSLFCKRPDILDILMELGIHPDPDLEEFYQALDSFRKLALKRLSTSLEDEAVINAYCDEAFRREEKAMKDLSALQQQLESERDERSKAFAELQASKDHLDRTFLKL